MGWPLNDRPRISFLSLALLPSPHHAPHARCGADARIMSAEVSAHGDTFEVGRTQPLFEVRSQRPGNVFDVTPDGQRFLVNIASEAQSSAPMTLVVNWPAALRR